MTSIKNKNQISEQASSVSLPSLKDDRLPIFEKEFLTAHNKYRLWHGVPPLRMNWLLSAYAREWAEHISGTGLITYRADCEYGENIYVMAGHIPKSGEEVVKHWYDENELYSFTDPTYSDLTRNFTQMIWKDTKNVGVGVATKIDTMYIVANYDPPGNKGDFIANVLARKRLTVREMEQDANEELDSKSSSSSSLRNTSTVTMEPEDEDEDTFINNALMSHNMYRAMHGVPPLTLNKELCDFANEWAEHLAKIRRVEPRPKILYGENIHRFSGEKLNSTFMIKSWYSQNRYFNFIESEYSPKTKEFTQMIWRKSREIGIGIGRNERAVYVVINYDPAGNIRGTFGTNVPSKIKEIDEVEVNKEILRKSRHPSFREASPAEVGQQQGLPRKSIYALETTGCPGGIDAAATVREYEECQFQRECVRAHNKYRALHGVPPVRINSMLCNLAMEWAQYLSNSDSFGHRPNNEFGESLYRSTVASLTGEEPVDKWYEEIVNYNFQLATLIPGTGHFTQLVWKSTREIGVGVVRRVGSSVVVVNYYPAGNMSGEFRKNVPPKNAEMELEDMTIFSAKPILQRGSILEKYSKTMGKDFKFKYQIMKAINKSRAWHEVPSLKVSAIISEHATDWAKRILTNRTFSYQPPLPYGEIIYETYNPNITGSEPVRKWYREKEFYDFNNPGLGKGTQRFTQLVWKDSKEIGLGVSRSGEKTVLVAYFLPKGNIEGEFEENVLPRSPLIDRMRIERKQRLANMKKTTFNVSRSTGNSSGLSSVKTKEREGDSLSDLSSIESVASITSGTQTSKDMSPYRQAPIKGSLVSEDALFEWDVLLTHNTLRAKHGSPPLIINQELSDLAYLWAKATADKKEKPRSTKKDYQYGENTFTRSDKRVKGIEPVLHWYAEHKQYSFYNPGGNFDTRHFTQVIWTNTKELGVGIAKRGKLTCVTVLYYPRGNVSNKYRENVAPLLEDSKVENSATESFQQTWFNKIKLWCTGEPKAN